MSAVSELRKKFEEAQKAKAVPKAKPMGKVAELAAKLDVQEKEKDKKPVKK